MSTSTLLIELGTEELPPKALKKLSDAFSREIINGLLEAQLIDAQASKQSNSFATPRRLAISVPTVNKAQPNQHIEKRGPAVKAAFKDDGQPTPAAQGFAKSCGVDITDLQTLKTDKGEWLSFNVEQQGESIEQLITGIIEQSIKRLPIAKRMRWGAGDAEFVRPVHWLIVMYGDTVLDSTILNIHSSNVTRGHRFHSHGDITVEQASDYQQTLADTGNVIASFDQRRTMIEQQITALAEEVGGAVVSDSLLLDEVTGLVEKPTAVLGDFDEVFLDVPQECLISSMRDHQKYFHVVDNNGKLLPNFITVSNIESKNPAQVKAGNERVLRARLADAQFFWLTDQKVSLESRTDKLDDVLFHIKLGSVKQKVERLQHLSVDIANKIGADVTIVKRAALLAKADLVSDMVGEFDELQGLMGRYYANIDGENALVGDCIEQHYWPKFAGDKLPISVEAQAVALADKVDSLVGIYASGEVPTGDKDPYALRRAALSILRILIEQQHGLTLSSLIADSAKCYADLQDIQIDAETQTDIVDFVRGRLTAFYQSQDIPKKSIQAVMACKPDSPLDFENRIKAVHEFAQEPAAEDLAAANKRISNILKKQAYDANDEININLLIEPAEQALHDAIVTIETDCVALFNAGNYTHGLQKLASLRTPIDNFFEDVMVMTDDPATQHNRLALLSKMQQLFLRVADISLLQ